MTKLAILLVMKGKSRRNTGFRLDSTLKRSSVYH